MSAEVEVQSGFLLSQHSRDVDDKLSIELWISTDNGPYCLEINNQKLVFFVHQKDKQQIELSLRSIKKFFDWKNLELKSFDQQPLAAIYFDSLQKYHDAKKILENNDVTLLEADIRPAERLLMERFIYGSLSFYGESNRQQGFHRVGNAKIKSDQYYPQLRSLSIDIECAENGELFSIGFYNAETSSPWQRVIMIGHDGNIETNEKPSWLRWATDEKQLLKQFISTVHEFDPDILIGWNVINFDCRLLLERAKLHNIQLTIGRDHSPASWRKSHDPGNGFITIAGRKVIDGIDALKTETYSFTSFSLENVAQELLGTGKLTENEENRLAEIEFDFLYNKLKLAKYNLQDCKLVWDIFKKTKVLDFLIFRSKLTGLELDKQGGSVAAFTNLYLPKLHRAGYIAPNLPIDGGLASPGGYVMDSKPGLYSNVLVLDFKSLYPSIIRTFKIDPLGLIEGLQHPDTAIAGFKDALFSRNKNFLPDIITQLWLERDQAKKDNDKAKSNAIKIIMNSFYGVLGSGGCRFYDTRLASSITMRVHQIMQETANWIEALGYNVIYGDTDSTFVLLDSELSESECLKIGKALADEINENWQHLINEEYQLKSQLEIEFETHYHRFLMPTIRGSESGSKKRYAGLIKKNGQEEIIFKGLESARTDWTELAKNFQAQLYKLVFNDEDPTTYISETVNRTLSGDYDDQLLYRKRLRRPLISYTKNIPPHVRAAKLADKENLRLGKTLKYQNKGWINYAITTVGPEPIEYLQHPFDYEHYVIKQLMPVADAILPFIGLSFSDICNKQIRLF